MRLMRVTFTTILTLCALLSAACEEEPIREYQAPKSHVIDPTGGRDVAGEPTDADQAPSRPARLRFAVPEHWQQVPDPTGMREVSLQAGEGEAAVTISGMALPASRFDIAANVQRWAGDGQAELADPTTEQLADAVEPFGPVDSGQSIVTLAGPQVGITAVIAPRGQRVWTFKMIGPAPRVAAEREAFERFARSIQFIEADTP